MRVIVYQASDTSPSSRRAWIEIVPKMSFYENNRVALLAEGVDRNPSGTECPVES